VGDVEPDRLAGDPAVENQRHPLLERQQPEQGSLGPGEAVLGPAREAEGVLFQDPDPIRVPDQGVGLDVALEDVGLDLEVAVLGAEVGGDRLGVLVTVVDRRLLEGEQVEAGEVLRLFDRCQDLVELQPEVEVPGAEAEPG